MVVTVHPDSYRTPTPGHIADQRQLFHGGMAPEPEPASVIASLTPNPSMQLLPPVTAIAEQLEQRLKTLDVRAASSLEKLVRDALELVESQHGISQSGPLPPDFVTRISKEFGSDPLDRPPQGEFEKRQEW